MQIGDLLYLDVPKGVKKHAYSMPLHKKQGVYYITNIPSVQQGLPRVYVGASYNLKQAFDQWRGRLASINGQPPLNIAFRALYDDTRKRADWVFQIAELLTANNFTGKGTLQEMLDEHITKHRARGQGACLNVGKTREEKEFWTAICPGASPAEKEARLNGPRLHRIALKIARVPKQTLMPGKWSTNVLTTNERNLMKTTRQPVVQEVERSTLSAGQFLSDPWIEGYHNATPIYYADYPGEIPEGAMRGGNPQPKR